MMASVVCICSKLHKAVFTQLSHVNVRYYVLPEKLSISGH